MTSIDFMRQEKKEETIQKYEKYVKKKSKVRFITVTINSHINWKTTMIKFREQK